MSGDLTTNAVARQNILNNPYALSEVEKATGIRGIPFEGAYVVTKEQTAEFFDVSARTIETYVEAHESELSASGYVVLKGKRLKSFKEVISSLEGTEVNFGTLKNSIEKFIRDMENISVQVADDTIDKALLGEIILAHIERDTENEALKLKIYEALSARNQPPNELEG